MRMAGIGKIGRWLGELLIQTTNPFPEKIKIATNTTGQRMFKYSVKTAKKT